MGIRRQAAMHALQQALRQIEPRTEGAQRVATRLLDDPQKITGHAFQRQVADEATGGQSPCRGAGDPLQQQLRGMLTQTDGDAHVVDAQEAAAGEREAPPGLDLHARILPPLISG